MVDDHTGDEEEHGNRTEHRRDTDQCAALLAPRDPDHSPPSEGPQRRLGGIFESEHSHGATVILSSECESVPWAGARR